MIFKPNYQRHGRAAAFIRNRLIVDTADVLIAFWDGKSTGTKYTIDYAKKQQKQVYVCQFDKSQSAKLPQSPTDDQTNNQ
ncbi:MAG: hypothetical protein Q4A69_07655 [Moraxella sp.]|nr:hypothetical protein [Moraxella sp.]